MTDDSPPTYRERIECAVGRRNSIEILEATPQELHSVVENTPLLILRARPFAGKWTPCEIVGHLIDAELVFGVRLRLMLAEDEPSLPNWNQNAWVERQCYNDADPADLAAQFAGLRAMNLPMWKSLGPSDLNRGGMHNVRGRETVAEMLRVTAGHDLLHLDQIRRYIAAAFSG